MDSFFISDSQCWSPTLFVHFVPDSNISSITEGLYLCRHSETDSYWLSGAFLAAPPAGRWFWLLVRCPDGCWMSRCHVMKFNADIYGAQRMNPTDFGGALMFFVFFYNITTHFSVALGDNLSAFTCAYIYVYFSRATCIFEARNTSITPAFLRYWLKLHFQWDISFHLFLTLSSHTRKGLQSVRASEGRKARERNGPLNLCSALLVLCDHHTVFKCSRDS